MDPAHINTVLVLLFSTGYLLTTAQNYKQQPWAPRDQSPHAVSEQRPCFSPTIRPAEKDIYLPLLKPPRSSAY